MIAVIDYGAGNLTSVILAIEAIGLRAEITNRPEVVKQADRVIFPGVGAAGSAMKSLLSLDLVDAIRGVIRNGKPFLGICLGTQIIMDRSEEDGGVECMGIVRGTVVPFAPTTPSDKVPQMGWNSVTQRSRHPVFDGIPDGAEFYFVHSYYPNPAQSGCVIGTTEYAGTTFASVLGSDNLVATQFHPEKSGRIGLKFLENFCRWNGTNAD